MAKDILKAGPERPAMRTEKVLSSVERARLRAEQIRNNLGENGLEDGTDRFYIDPDTIPEGWSYEWKRKLVYGQADPAYEVELSRKGWEAVPASRHPEMMPAGKYETIERDGLILMERPKELTDEAKNVELRKARAQVRSKEQQLEHAPEGTMTRDHPNARPSIKKGYAPMQIPSE